MDRQIIYTDGSCDPDGNGGWAIYLPYSDTNRSGADKKTTNNRMELYAFREALRHALRNKRDTTICTDSEYVMNGYTKWMFNWAKSSFSHPKNSDMWKDLYSLWIDLKNAEIDVDVTWVRGHAEDEHNKKVDKLAVAARKMPKKVRNAIKYVNSKISKKPKRKKRRIQSANDFK